MHTGHYISGAGHLGLIGWLLLGPMFDAAPPEMQVTEVSVVSSQDYAAMMEAFQPPQSVTEVAEPPQPETPDDTPPEAPAEAPPPEPVPEPRAPAPEQPADPVPEVPQPAPVPAPDVSEPAPQPEPPAPEQSFTVPEVSPRPQPRPAPRVAPEPVAPPEPDVTIADQTQTAPDPEATTDTPPDAEETTVEEEAAPEIVTEAEEPASSAPSRSVRPQPRPQQLATAAPAPDTPAEPAAPETPAETPAAAPEQEPQPAPQPPVSSDAVTAALEEALGGAAEPEPSAPSGPPLTTGEREALRVAVQDCWVVDVGSQAANVTVTLAMSMDRDGKVVGDIRMIGSEGGDSAAAQTAFQAARRAILRCQKDGYQLPAEKYDQWRDIEMTFNPEKMRLR